MAWGRYPLDPTVDAVEVLLTTGGMPMNARIEILQGPDTNKQAAPGMHTDEMISHAVSHTSSLRSSTTISTGVLIRHWSVLFGAVLLAEGVLALVEF